MSKGSIFVVGYSIVILILFVVFCVLMSNVNPGRFVATNGTRADIKLPQASKRSHYLYDLELNEDSDRDLKYGLEKVSLEEYTGPPEVKSTLRMYNNDSECDVKQTVHSTLSLNINETTQDNSMTSSPYFRGQRRSIREQPAFKVNKQGPEAVLVKIIDESGYPRIEIKLNPKQSVKSIASEANINTYVSDDRYVNSIYEHGNNTVLGKSDYNLIDGLNIAIDIMPNNTLYFDKIDNSSMNYIITEIVTDKQENLDTFVPLEMYNMNTSKNIHVNHDGTDAEVSAQTKIKFK